MQVEFRESFAYEAWIVSSPFGTPASYRIYLRVLDPGRANWFANKHLGDDAAKVLRRRTFQGVPEADRWDALERYGVQVKADFQPKKPPPTNTVVDFRRIDKKLAAYLLAKKQPNPDVVDGNKIWIPYQKITKENFKSFMK